MTEQYLSVVITTGRDKLEINKIYGKYVSIWLVCFHWEVVRKKNLLPLSSGKLMKKNSTCFM